MDASAMNELKNAFHRIETPFWILKKQASNDLSVQLPTEFLSPSPQNCYIPALTAQALGSPAFRAQYGTKYACYAGAMASAIASEEMVIALGKAGLMGSFGAAGLSIARLEASIQKIQAALPHGPWAFNLINSPQLPGLEQRVVELYLKNRVDVIEASAYLDVSAALVYYRVMGLSRASDGAVKIGNRIIAKISRKEVAVKFLSPAPEKLLNRLVEEGKITPDQAELARSVPMADDVTVEADSGGHTDNRPLVSLLPTMLALRNETQKKFGFPTPVRIGAGGGIGTPQAALAAFMLGADYVVTGSVNQACVEAGVCAHTREVLATVDMADVTMAPAADMFEMGVRVQVLKRGTLFAMRASKLYEIYSKYDSIEAIPAEERDKLEKQIFKRSMDEIWAETVRFFTERDPGQLDRAAAYPKHRMALVFRWYLGLSSRWSATGEPGREMDYQIWCGPSMGAFNDWVRGTYLEQPANRRVVDVNLHILTGAAYLQRVQAAKLQGVPLPLEFEAYLPEKPIS